MDIHKHTILNVDDYQPGLYARSKILRQAGFLVLEAASGARALELVALQKPALVLLDVNLPDMSGIEVCKRIRLNPLTAATTIVHVSASNVQSKHQVYGLDSGADSYIVEPVDPAVLVATVRAFLRARQAEDALRQSNEDLERFAYMVTHELNEPLRTISAHAQLLVQRLGDKLDGHTSESFKFMVDGTQRMRSFMDDLLRYSQAAHRGIDVRSFELETILARVIADLGAAIQDTGARITHDPLPAVLADARIEHVFQNLIGNAIKYRRPDIAPHVHVSARQEGEDWVFSVQDNGLGIDPAYRESIFHIFRRLHGKDVPGNGIGLALSLKIVEAHGGTMWVDSEPGAGSTFHFRLPLQSLVASGGTA
jgi:two-component system sensor histidine kinase/response regulator